MAESIVAASLAFVIISRTRRRRKIQKRKIWSRDWLKNRTKNGAYHQLMKELQLMDTSGYKNFLRMDSSTFSMARRTVDNAFGISSNRFRVFMTPIGLPPEKVELITLASCILHNFLRTKMLAQEMYMPHGSINYEDPITH